jgi:hypothetical protein
MKSNLDFKNYQKLLKAVGSMSGLYSSNEIPLFHPRFIEKLFVLTAQAEDLARDDMSFDARIDNNIGVGIKTFGSPGLNNDKTEKVAEFTKYASAGEFDKLNVEQLAYKSAELRNIRIQSDITEYGIDISKSFYHCLVRSKGVAMIHEEPYELIDISSIKPTNSRGKEISNFDDKLSGHSYFSDGKAKYVFNRSKNVLLKRFELKKFCNSPIINIEIYEDIFSRILEMVNSDVKELITEKKDKENYVILPLYSTKGEKNYDDPDLVQQSAAINQWRAGGRVRKFGESYIPLPAKVHELKPGFFPGKGHPFKLKLPNGKVVDGKACSGNPEKPKHIMSYRNADLLEWLFELIDGNMDIARKRLENSNPYTFKDLLRVERDSVKITKNENGEYYLQTMPIDSYEKFINGDFE